MRTNITETQLTSLGAEAYCTQITTHLYNITMEAFILLFHEGLSPTFASHLERAGTQVPDYPRHQRVARVYRVHYKLRTLELCN